MTTEIIMRWYDYWNFLKAVVVTRYICNHLQVFFEKDHLKLHWRIPLPGSLSFFNKVDGWRPESLLKWDSCTNIFLWILRNFQEYDVYGTPCDDCFFKYYGRVLKSTLNACFRLLNIFAKHSILEVARLMM